MINSTLTEKAIEVATEKSPGWLAELRRDAWDSAERMLPPTRSDEHWRYTDLNLLDSELYQRLDNGTAFSTELSGEVAARGVIFTDLDTAANEHEELVRPRLGKLVGASDIYTARNLALHRGGAFLYVPAGVELSVPLQSLHRLTMPGVIVQPRMLIVVERGAKVFFNDVYTSLPVERPSLVNPVTELYAAEGSEVGWVTWQEWGEGVRHLSNMKATLGAGARLSTMLVTLGGDFSRTWKECEMAGEGSESLMLGLYFARRKQHFEHWTVQDHLAPNTRSDLLYKGALDGQSRTVYYGTIKVRPDARNTDAYQANRNLALSRKAKADTNPQLEIETNDVRCTHGATVGQVDGEHLYYLMSRGIPRADAERLLIFGFFNEVLDRAQWSGMYDQLADSILRKLEAGV